jgi:hypothetical protein
MDNWIEFNPDVINDSSHIIPNLAVKFNAIKHGVDCMNHLL